MTLLAYVSIIEEYIERYPKLALIFGLLIYAAFGWLHLAMYDNSRPYFSITTLGSVAIAMGLIVSYKQPMSVRQRPDILSTDNDWFSKRELA